MRRPLAPEDAKLWSLVTATVRPIGERKLNVTDPKSPVSQAAEPKPPMKTSRRPVKQAVDARPEATPAPPPPPPLKAPAAKLSLPEDIEPRRRRRISRSREPIGARLDLHGMDQSKAEAAVFNFVRRAHEAGMRAVLIISGKGTLGDGILRRRTPEWLSDPSIRPLIAGFSFADRHHGGDGALYVALKRSGR